MARFKALVVGIDDYPPPNQLPSCVNDANAVSGLLHSAGFEVDRLINGQATIAAVTDRLRELFKDAKPDDRLIFYYSGHGYTDRKGSLMEEYLVLMDGLFQDDVLSGLTQALAPGVLTVILDSCFSGGMEKRVLLEEGAETVVELAKVKAWQPTSDDLRKFGTAPRPEVAKSKSGEPVADKVVVRKFGLSPAASKRVVTRAAADSPMAALGKSMGMMKGPGSDEVGQTQTQGLVVAACLETETAAASTSRTEGKSAFTHALLAAVREIGIHQPTTAIFERAAEVLKSLNFRQTPLVMAPSSLPALAGYSFLTLQPPGGPGAPSSFAGAAASATGSSEIDPKLIGAVLAALIPALVEWRAKSALPSWPQPGFAPPWPPRPVPSPFNGGHNGGSEWLADLLRAGLTPAAAGTGAWPH